MPVPATIPRIESLQVRNFRALRRVDLAPLAPLTTLLGANGSGKSTVFDVFAFLAECFSAGLAQALEKRGRMKELRSRGEDGPIEITIQYREPDQPIVTYDLAIDEEQGRPVVVRETLRWRRGSSGKPFHFLDYERGSGWAIAGDVPDKDAQRQQQDLESAETLAVSALGQFQNHPRVVALKRFITGWYLSYLSASDARGFPEAGPHPRLERTGANLANVVQYLKERHPERLGRIFEQLRRRVPRLEKIETKPLEDGRLLLQLKDAPFEKPVLARFASDGTLKLLMYLIVLHDPSPPPVIGIEEPENYLHPRLLRELAEECRAATARSQLIVTTHSPFFVDGLRPEELWALYRDEQGFTGAARAADMPRVARFLEEGATLGELWMEGHLSAGNPGDPLPRPSRKAKKGSK